MMDVGEASEASSSIVNLLDTYSPASCFDRRSGILSHCRNRSATVLRERIMSVDAQ